MLNGVISQLNRISKYERLWAAAILIFALFIFFSTPIQKFATHIYAAADMSQLFPPMQVTPAATVQNTLFFDTFEANQPWLIFNREILRQGQLPLWNPLNANGVPHLANYQSTVFSVFSLPFYVLPFKLAILLSDFMKLFGIGFFTYAFLKQIGIKQLPSLLGGIAFMFSGSSVLWLHWTITGVTFSLPACLYFAEQIFGRIEHRSEIPAFDRRTLRSLAGFCLSLLVGLLAGHPETFYFCLLLIALYIFFRLIDRWRQARFRLTAGIALIRLGIQFCVAALLAAGLSAPQLLPFLEYVANSATEHRTAIWQSAAQLQWWPLAIYPNLLGTPANPYTLNLIGQVYNYNEINAAYLNAICLLLVLLGVLFLRGNQYRRYFAFFGGVALLWLIYAGNILGLKNWFNAIPGVSYSFYGRSTPILLFALSMCAAISLNHLIALPKNRIKAISCVFFGIGLLIVSSHGAYHQVKNLRGLAAASAPEAVISHLAQLLTHINLITASSGLGIALVGLIILSPQGVLKAGSCSLIIVIVFTQSGLLLKDFNPTVEDRLLYPVTPVMAAAQRAVQKNWLLVVENWLMPPNTNLPYGLSMISNYDSIGVQDYERLVADRFGAFWPMHSVRSYDEASLKLFGIETILTPKPAVSFGPTETNHFDVVVDEPLYSLLKYKNALPRYHTVVNSIIANSDEEALALLRQKDFDPAQTVILSPPVAAPDMLLPDRDTSVVTVETEQSARVVLIIKDRKLPGYVVLAKTYYPGWKARINGLDQPVYRANYAFSAVPLLAGDNRIEFYYDPDSFKVGVLIALVSLGIVLIGLACCVFNLIT